MGLSTVISRAKHITGLWVGIVDGAWTGIRALVTQSLITYFVGAWKIEVLREVQTVVTYLRSFRGKFESLSKTIGTICVIFCIGPPRTEKSAVISKRSELLK